MKIYPLLLSAILLGSAFAATAQAGSGSSREDAPQPQDVALPTHIVFDWSPVTRKAVFQFGTGCVSTSMRDVRDTLRVRRFGGEDRIFVDGGWRGLYLGLISSADCMGARYKTVTLDDVEPGIYHVYRKGKVLWSLTLGKSEVHVLAD